MASQVTFAHKLSQVLRNAKQSSGQMWTQDRWLAVVNEFANVERPIVARTKRATPYSNMSEEQRQQQDVY